MKNKFVKHEKQIPMLGDYKSVLQKKVFVLKCR